MAEPITTPLIQATLLLTCWFIIQHFLTSARTFCCYLECRAPSRRRFLHKLSRSKHVPMKKKGASAARKSRNKIESKQNKLSTKTHLLVLSKWVDCQVDRALHMYLQDIQDLSVFYTTACYGRERISRKLTELFMAYNFVVDKEGNHAKEIHETWPLNLRSNQNEGDAEHSGSKAPSTNKPSATKQQQQHLLQKFIDNLAKHWHKTSMVITTHLRDLRRIYKLLTCCYRGSHFARSSTEQAICDIADNTTKQFLHHGLIHETMRFLASQCAHHQAKQLQNKMHAVQHSFSRPEHFLSTQEGTYLKAAHIFRGSFFALQNSIPIGNNILCWSQHARPGLKFIPNSISLGRTYQVTASTTTDILPKNNFSLHDFFTSIRHIPHDVTKRTTWKQPSGPHRSATPQNTKETSIATKSEHNDSIRFIRDPDPQDDFNTSLDVSQADPMHDSEGATPPKPGLPFAGTLLHWWQYQISSSVTA